jgi:hypothetical protein
MAERDAWPELPLAEWKPTRDTLHMYTQIVGKVRLVLSPTEPQWAHVALYVTARGLTTSPIAYDGRVFEIDFDLVDHALEIDVSDGSRRRIPLVPRTVAAFYAEVMEALRSLGIDVEITTKPQEVPDPIPFPEDEVHHDYDPQWANRFWRALVQVDAVLREYRARFRGRTTPTQFFWGSFDLACSRFSGRPADPPPGSNILYRLGMNAEDVCAGWWPGDDRFPEPAFYSYTYPKPDGLERAELRPPQAFWSDELGEFVLRYEDARAAESPRQAVLDFLQSAYEAGATLSNFDRAALEG